MGFNISDEQLEAMIPFCSDKRRAEFLSPLNGAMNEFQINTPLRIAAFIAQITHESGSLRYVEEIADGSAYTGRKDLGNASIEAIQLASKYDSQTGPFYKGRGLIQITGYYNYKECGEALGLDLVNQPEILCETINACRSAAWFWNRHGLNGYADVGLFGKITNVINGGYNGASDRLAHYARCKKILGI